MLMNDVLYLQNKFIDILKNFVKDFIVLLTAFFTMFIIHSKTAFVLLLLTPIITFYMGKSGKRIANFSEAFQMELAKLARMILDLRKRFEFIKSQQGERYEATIFDQHNEKYYLSIRKSIFIKSSFAPIVESAGFILFAFIIYLSTTDFLSYTHL